MTDFLKRWSPKGEILFLFVACAFLAGLLFSVQGNKPLAKSVCSTNQIQIGQNCTTLCPDRSLPDHGRACQCPEKFEMYNGACTPSCSSGRMLVNNSCQCVSGQENGKGVCISAACSGGMSPNSNDGCSCPNNQESIDGVCQPICTGGKLRNDQGICQCPANQEIYNGACVPECSGYKFWKSDACICHDTAENAICKTQCALDEVVNLSGGCSCAPGRENFQGNCVSICQGGEVRDDQGKCKCPTGQELSTNICYPRCLGGQIRNEKGICTCDSNFEWVGNECVPECTNLKQRINGICQCLPGSKLTQGICPNGCSGGMLANASGGCRCYPPATEVNGLCVSPPSSAQAATSTACLFKGCHMESEKEVCNVRADEIFLVSGFINSDEKNANSLLSVGAPHLGFIPPEYPFVCDPDKGDHLCQSRSLNSQASFKLRALTHAVPRAKLFEFGFTCDKKDQCLQPDFFVRICP